MPRFYEMSCSGDQLRILKRNEFKYLLVGDKHIRIRDSQSVITPPGPVIHTVSIEILEAADKTWGEADPEAQKVVAELFGHLLQTGFQGESGSTMAEADEAKIQRIDEAVV